MLRQHYHLKDLGNSFLQQSLADHEFSAWINEKDTYANKTIIYEQL